MRIPRLVPLLPSALVAVALLFAPAPLRAQQEGRIVGTVSTDAGQPLPGASVLVEGTGRGTLTGGDGRFVITGVPAGTHRVSASLIGYGTQTRSVTVGAGQATTAAFQLAAEAVALEGIVAVGYGTQRRRDLTGAVSSVNVDEVRTAPVVSVDQVLQGRATGVQVTQSSGAPGGAVSVRIRGTNSISANSEPLYVIDGVPAFVGNAESPGGRGLPLNPLADLSPNDIESIEVLKDASATAIYGSRGANGVVLVTTKRGRRGENSVQLESSYGMQEITRTLDLLNARQYAELLNEGQTNVGRPAIFTPEQIAAFGEGTDWQDEIYRTAPVQNHALTFSGGDDRTRYLVTGSFFDQEGIVVNSAFRRYSARINLDRDLSDRFRIGNSLTLSRTRADQIISDNQSGPSSGAILGALEFEPTSPVRDENGNYVRTSSFIAIPNPVATALEITNERIASRVVGNLFAEYDLTEGLRFRTSLGGNAFFERENYYAPSYVAQGQGSGGSASVGTTQASEVVNDNIITYRRALGEGHDLDLTGGFTAQTYRSEWLSGGAQQFATDVTGQNSLGSGAQPLNPGSGVNEWTLMSWLGRANYNLLDRYLFTLTGRYDGSSKFGANNKWGFFPSGAVAWRLSDEPMLRGRLGPVSDLKLRASYGETGNQEIGTYTSLARLSTYSYNVGGARVIGYAPAGLAPNPDLKWESTRQLDVGADASLFDNRVNLTADLYRSRTDDLLLTVPMPANTGYSSQLRNIGSIENRGVEFSLSTVNVDREGFSWRTSLNLARNRNEVVDLGGVDRIFVSGGGPVGGLFDTNDFSILQVGQPLGSYYAFPTNGIWQTGDTCPFSSAAACTPGEYRFVDTNGDRASTPEDRVIVGNSEADLFGGLTNNLAFGAFSLDVFVNGSLGNDVLNVSALRLGGMGSGTNSFAWVYDRWTPTNPSSRVPRANNSRARRLLDVHVEDGSFVRLQNVTLGYRIPQGIVPRASTARLYVSGQNLWVWTDYSGYDPEMNSYGGHPIFRGIDLGAYPRARTVNLGVNVTF